VSATVDRDGDGQPPANTAEIVAARFSRPLRLAKGGEPPRLRRPPSETLSDIEAHLQRPDRESDKINSARFNQFQIGSIIPLTASEVAR